MMKPNSPANESERIANLYSYDILDSAPDPDFDELVQLASEIAGTDISLISLIDSNRQWFKAKCGLEAHETSREISFCGHAILKPNEVMMVEDAREDERFHDNPLVTDGPFIRFYAGFPLVSTDGHALGTLCVIDDEPHELSSEQISSLQILARQAVKLMDLKKQNEQLVVQNHRLTVKNREVEQFASLAAHDIKSPLNAIQGFSELILNQYADQHELKEMMEVVCQSSQNLASLIDELLEYARLDETVQEQRKLLRSDELIQLVEAVLPCVDDAEIEFVSTTDSYYINPTAIKVILLNLINNAIKYGDKEKTQIRVVFSVEDGTYQFVVKDNGPGIPDNKKQEIFKPFKTAKGKDRYGKKGTGLGLARVTKLSELMGGTVEIDSELGKGSSFIVRIPKTKSAVTQKQ